MVTTLRFDNQTVRVDDGELIAYLIGHRELIHQKGSPGWRNSDTEMFPIIGPTAEAGFRVETPRGQATQDQHGLLRELAYTLVEATDTRAVYEKTYTAGKRIENSKFPAKSTAEHLSWPYDFRFRKTFTLDDKGLTIEFEIHAEPGMPFMLGYHPAFRLTSERVEVHAGSAIVTLEEVAAVGDRAYELPGVDGLTLRDGGEAPVRVEATGFGNFMLWSPTPNMMCVEPVTFYPYAVPQSRLHEGFTTIGSEPARFGVTISAPPHA